MLRDLPRVIATLKTQAATGSASGDASLLYEQLANLIFTLMGHFSGFPELYEPVVEVSVWLKRIFPPPCFQVYIQTLIVSAD